jgi:beta-galactosidase
MPRRLSRPRWWILLSGILLISVLTALCADPQRERLLMDFGWKFHPGNEWGIAQDLSKAGTGSGPASTSFSDASWRTVNLPHDWAIELPFDSNADGGHGFKAVGRGFPSNSVAWYRRTFELPKGDSGKRLWIEFDGAFRDCSVFLNGWFVGHHEGGYGSFRYDVTDVANCGGKNILAVKVDASEFEGWFYEGAGIYRHVWLVKTGPVAIAPDGIFVSTQFKNNIPEGPAPVSVETSLMNSQTEPADVRVECSIVDSASNVVAQSRETITITPSSTATLKQATQIRSPVLWSPESPALYHLVTTVWSGNKLLDRAEREFGIRTVAFDADKGFLLNGKPYVLKGTCNHQDHAGVGVALPDRLQYFRVSRLKEMGCNAYRTSHNPPTPELLEACDRLGMLVMDENRLLGSDRENLERLESFVRRDRNHPSVAIWSIANEEFSVQSRDDGGRVAETMQRRVKQLDPTRPVTCAANVGNEIWGISRVIEVRGWNYHIGETNMDAYHREHPNQPNVGTEQASTVSTRGIYANDPARGYVSAYDDNAPSWANTAEAWWTFFASRPWLSGGFAWTGFDYRGEPTPYGWPCINSHFGILDTCGFPKDNFYYYQAVWTEPAFVHLLPHWNWPGKEGQEIDVRVIGNCDEVELALNGKSLGRAAATNSSPSRWKVKYAPGELTAVGFRHGNAVARSQAVTTGPASQVQLQPDRATINADGEDVSVVTVSLSDSEGRLVPVATNLVSFDLEGPGRILGVGNGDPSCHEPDIFVPRSPLRSAAVGGWRWHAIEDAYHSDRPEVAEQFDDAGWATDDVRRESGPLAERQHGVFRTHVQLTEQDLSAESVELSFGMIDEEGWVYINGRKVGESHDWKVAPVFDVKRFLRVGDNTIAVAIANNNGAGGLNRGAALVYQEKPEMPRWQRSVFNGLAQILVQGTKQPGEIKLSARSEGLAPSTITLHSQACMSRPSVP